jgi:hypothetical protein
MSEPIPRQDRAEDADDQEENASKVGEQHKRLNEGGEQPRSPDSNPESTPKKAP